MRLERLSGTQVRGEASDPMVGAKGVVGGIPLEKDYLWGLERSLEPGSCPWASDVGQT